MKNTNKIVFNEKYQEKLKKLEKCEKDRAFCGHTSQHFYDVARIFYLLILENKLDFSKDMAYTTAFLHDIGRVDEYEKEIPHDIASRNFAKEMLQLTDYSEKEKELILQAISKHRGENSKEHSFSALFAKADNLSRPCWDCPAEKDCYWSRERKNLRIKY